MIHFILNDAETYTDLSPGITLLDYIRYQRNLKGTKIGCREGDCGACTVLLGELKESKLIYRSVTSCLVPLGNVQGKHVVTIEGINFSELNPVQQALCDESASQCGFCTPGFVVSLAGYCLSDLSTSAMESTDGNICRCTGYKSLERAAGIIERFIKERKEADPVQYAIDNKIVPSYFLNVKKDLQKINMEIPGELEKVLSINENFVGGGTDLYVQKHEEMIHAESVYLSGIPEYKAVKKEGRQCVIGGAVTITEMIESPVIRKIFPQFLKYTELISSTQIRNMATVGGNLVNASPIGDLTILFLALDAKLILDNKKSIRVLPLREFYKSYRNINKTKKEVIREIIFDIPGENTFFNFEKVSKRTHLDIASVNSSILITISEGVIKRADIAAGGIGPIPFYLKDTSAMLIGKSLSEKTVDDACRNAGREISPISDARGSATYKRFLLQQLIRAHFITLFSSIRPEKFEIAYEEY